MARVEDLIPGFSDMSSEELVAKIQEIRKDRSVQKRKPKGTSKKKSPALKITQLLANMTEAQKLELLEKLNK